MPGIVGLVTKAPREDAERELGQMVKAMCHESFYTSGTWIDETLGIYVGWVARKDSFADRMPIWNERRDVALVFAGEEYPEPGTRARLKARGHDLNTRGPSYLVHMYEEDPGFPANLNGQFHGLVVDVTRRNATLFNDRYGMQRLYVHQAKESFYFAAEAKAILAVRPELRRADNRSLGEFVACGCVLQNRTLFSGIHVLPGAAAWLIRNAAVERRTTYFQPSEWEGQAPLDPEAYYREVRDAFSRNLPRYFNGDQQIGVALTGGLDTRAIMAWTRPARQSLRCYTFGSMFRDNQDVRVARRVSRVCEQSHEAIAAGDEFLTRFAHYAERSVYLTDGTCDLTRAPDLYVSEKARDIAPVKIVGTYGSELLVANRTFKPIAPLPGLFAPELLDDVRQAGVTYAGFGQDHPVTFAAFRQSPWWHIGTLALERTQLVVRSPFLDNDFVRATYRLRSTAGAGRDVRLRLIRDGDSTLAAISTDRGVGGRAGRLVEQLSRTWLEFTYKAEYAYDYGMPQRLARIDHLLAPLHLERLFLGRHKPFHFRVWYRDALSRYVRDMLLDSRALSRPYVERRAVEQVVSGHIRGDRNYTREIHKLLTLELQQRLFFDAN